MRVLELCERPVVTLDWGARVVDAARLLHDAGVGELVITRGRARRPIGLISERDIVIMAVAQAPEHLKALTVGDLLGDGVDPVNESDPLGVVLDRMSQTALRRLPVVNDQGQAVGVIGFDVLVGRLLAERRRQERRASRARLRILESRPEAPSP